MPQPRPVAIGMPSPKNPVFRAKMLEVDVIHCAIKMRLDASQARPIRLADLRLDASVVNTEAGKGSDFPVFGRCDRYKQPC
jgi:hypothetical protein